MASTRRHATATPSTWPSESPRVPATQVKRVSDQQFFNALETLKSAKIDKKEKDLALCGLKDSAEDCEKLAQKTVKSGKFKVSSIG